MSAVTYGPRRARRRCDSARCRARRTGLSLELMPVAAMPARDMRSRCRCWALTTRGTRRRRSPPRARSASRATRRGADSNRRTVCPGGSSAWTPASDSTWWWTTRTRRMRSSARSPRCASTSAGRVLLVFGCGGDRDRAKRPRMGAVAARDADRAWVTSDNPRSEDPGRHRARHRRRRAARRGWRSSSTGARPSAAAIGAAAAGDVVLIAGKGHETTQTIGDRVLPFDDRVVARELLSRPGGGALDRGRRAPRLFASPGTRAPRRGRPGGARGPTRRRCSARSSCARA